MSCIKSAVDNDIIKLYFSIGLRNKEIYVILAHYHHIILSVFKETFAVNCEFSFFFLQIYDFDLGNSEFVVGLLSSWIRQLARFIVQRSGYITHIHPV